jgi:hypothetical protein
LIVYPGFFAISQLSNETHRVLAAVDTSISKKVPESAYAYYAAVLGYARLLRVLSLSSRRITADEESFMAQVFNGNFSPPESLSFYLKGFGNAKLQNQRDLRFRAKPRPTIASADGSIGWFGKIDQNTHYLYATYPCLAVYMKRIQADWNFTQDPHNEDPNWDLPDDITPDPEPDEDHDPIPPGKPTKNLLGWAPARRLGSEQVAWLHDAGFGPDFGFDSEHDTIPFMLTLMNAVQTEINNARLKTNDVPATSDGSLTQTVVTTVPFEPEYARDEGRNNMIAKHAFDMSGSLVVAAKSLRYLQEHRVVENGLNTWSIYEWEEYASVPDGWQASANRLFDDSSDILKSYCYRTVPAAPVTEVRKLVDILLPKE